MSLVKVLVLITLIAVVSARLSYYYADQGLNYHPPYDKYTGAYDINGTTGASTCRNTFTCPPGFSRRPNPNFVASIPTACPVPAWVSNQNGLVTYDGCCQRYSACLQTCGASKGFCDGQFYGCAYSSCDPQRNLRPGDRLYCRTLSACYSSYLTRSSACTAFNDYQNAACICSNSTVVASASPSATSPLPIGKRQNLANETATASSVSPIPSASQTSGQNPATATATNTFTNSPVVAASTTTSTQAAATSNSVAPSLNAINSADANLYANRFGTYFLRPIPRWELFQNRCPPNFENYVAVFTDQEQDDIGYYGRNQGSGAATIGSWLKF